METYNYRSAEMVYARIGELLFSFGMANQLDVGQFYDWTKYILQKLELPMYTKRETVLEVSNYYTPLPDDFYKIWAVWSTKRREVKRQSRLEYQSSFTFLYKDTKFKNAIEKGQNCESITPVETQVIKRDFYYKDNDEIESIVYDNTVLLKAGRVNTEFCAPESPSVLYTGNAEEFTIKNNNLYFNFKEGNVVVQYNAFPKDERGIPMIPDNPYIEEAIITYITFKALQLLYYNGIGDVQQRKDYARAEFDLAYRQAEYYVRMPDYQEMVKAAKQIQTRWYELLPPEARNNVRYTWFYTPRI